MRYLTTEDLEAFYAMEEGHPFYIPNGMIQLLKTAGSVPMTSNYYNVIYGPMMWTQLNQEANVFGALPKTTWPHTGFRVQTAFASASENIGFSVTDNLPSAVYPTVVTVAPSAKQIGETFEVPEALEALAAAGTDDIWGTSHQMKVAIGTEVVKRVNQQLMHKVGELASAWANFETLDRIVSKYNEQGMTSNGWNLYNITKSDASHWANAYVNDSSSLRDLTDDLVRDLLAQTRIRGGNPSLIVTGADTYSTLLGMYMTFVRYAPIQEMLAQFGVNGVQTAKGIEAGIQISSLYGIPLISTADCPSTTNGISWIYALDISDPEGYGYPRLGISLLMPLQYFETDNYFIVNKVARKGMYLMLGETVARMLRGQGKLRDIQ